MAVSRNGACSPEIATILLSGNPIRSSFKTYVMSLWRRNFFQFKRKKTFSLLYFRHYQFFFNSDLFTVQ